MAEPEPGHPDELVAMMRNWFAEASSPVGQLPEGMDAIEWTVRRFIESWRAPVRATIEALEESLRNAAAACDAGDMNTAQEEISAAQQLITEDLREDFGLYEWNK